MFIVNITHIIHSLKFCGFNQLLALKPQFGLQTYDQMDMDMENKEHWKGSEKPEMSFWKC